MTPPKKLALAGCGGIGVVLAPLLCRSADIVLCDEDSYEPSNHGRQFPSLHSSENKAKTLASIIATQTLRSVQHVPHYIKDVMFMQREEMLRVDMIVGAVDNNRSRSILIEVAAELEIPCILAGNEHEHGEAHLFIPGVYNPLEHFEFPDGDTAPWACNADKTLELYPQTATANQLAAGCAIHLLNSYILAKNPVNCLGYSRLDPFGADCRRVKNLLAATAVA